MKNNKKLNSCLGYVAWVGDYAIAAIAAPWVANHRVREDIMDVKNMDKWVPIFETYKRHFVEHVKNHNNNRMTVRALKRCRMDTKKFDPFDEIDKKKIVAEDIKTYGVFPVEVKLYNGISASLFVSVGD